MLRREDVRDWILDRKSARGLTWADIGRALGRSPVYAALLAYGYGQADEREAENLIRLLELPPEASKALTAAPYRKPVQPWPPTDPFVYRLYEVVLLYGPVLKDIAHELFGDGIMSAIDMTVDLKKVEEDGVERMVLTLNGKWLRYRKF